MTEFPSKEAINRREFLRGSIRNVLLAGISALTARALANGGDRLTGQTCVNDGICRPCPSFDGCGLPQAISLKQAMTGYREVRRIPALGTTSRRIETGPGDALFIASGNRVISMNSEGVRGLEIALNAPVRCVTVARDGTIYAALRDHIEVFDGKGKKLAAWSAPEGKPWFTGLAAGESDLFAADAGNRIVLRYDRGGKLAGRIGAKNEERDIPGFVIPSPYFNVKLHPDGLLRVNNPGRHRVEAYTFNGDFEGAWGKPGDAIESFCGCCNPINLAVLADGRFVTCEKGLPRVKVYSAQGEFESVVAGTDSFPENAKAGAGERDLDAALAGLDAAVDSRGRIFILDLVTSEIRVMEPIRDRAV